MTVTAPEAEADTAVGTLEYLDPRTLAANPANIRKTLGDLASLTASIRAVGVLVPLIVIPDHGDGGHRIVAGHRRNQAAIEAEQARVPCLVRPDLASANATVAQVVAMLTENTNRLELSAGDEARGVEQLRLAGLSPAKIATALGQKPAQVKRALAVAGSELGAAAVDRYDLTLAQAAVLVEFESDDAAIKSLVVTAKKDPARWDHVVSRLREDRKTANAYAAAVQRLVDAGVTILDAYPRGGGGPVRLDRLIDGNGNVLDADSHAACPGHAVIVSDHNAKDLTFFCVDPAGNGHKERWPTATPAAPSVVDGKMTEEAKADRRAVIEANKQWRAAEPVRREWIRDLLARKTPPSRAVLRFAVAEILAEPDRVGDGKDDLLADLLRRPAPGSSYGRHVGAAAAAATADARLPLLLLAQVAAAVEHSMTEATWRSVNRRAACWFAFLATTGYTLADIEQRVVNDAANASAAAADGACTPAHDGGDAPDGDTTTEDAPAA